MDPKFIVAVVLVALAVILDIVGLAIPYWNKADTEFVSYNSGLWSTCVEGTCVSYPSTTGSLLATRAMVILGMLLAIGALVVFLLRQFMMKDKPVLNKVAAGLAILAGVLILIGVIIYGTDSQFKENLHAGFGITIVAAVFAIAGAVFMWISPTEE